MIYVDSSALVPLYVPERFSASARSVAQDVRQLPFTALHQLEVPNAFELLVGRGLITRDECRTILQQVQDDLEGQYGVNGLRPADRQRRSYSHRRRPLFLVPPTRPNLTSRSS